MAGRGLRRRGPLLPGYRGDVSSLRAADDALYWIGRTADLYLSDPRQSLAAYRSVLRHYPESPRVAESQFRLAELYETRFSDDRRASTNTGAF